MGSACSPGALLAAAWLLILCCVATQAANKEIPLNKASLQGRAILVAHNYPRGAASTRTLYVVMPDGTRVHVALNGSARSAASLHTGMGVRLEGRWLSRGAGTRATGAGAGAAGRRRATLPFPQAAFRFLADRLEAREQMLAGPAVRGAGSPGGAGTAATASGPTIRREGGRTISSNPPLTTSSMSAIVIPIAAKTARGGACPRTSLPLHSAAEVRAAFFSELNPRGVTVAGTFARCSYGAARLTMRNSLVTDTVELPCRGKSNGVPWTFSKCDFEDFNGWADAADEKLRAARVKLDAYFHRVYLLPPAHTCGFVGLAYIGCNGGFECRSWISGGLWTTPQAIAHELGHNLFLGHSGAVMADGEFDEYADATGMMGYCCDDRCPATPHAWQLGWAQLLQLDGRSLPRGATVEARLASQSNPAANAAATVRGLRVVVDWVKGVEPVFAGFRARIGGDTGLVDAVANRLSVYQSAVQHVYDAMPTVWKAALAVGQAWQEPRSGLVLRYRGVVNGTHAVTVCRRVGSETASSCKAGLDFDCNGLAGPADPACARLLRQGRPPPARRRPRRAAGG